jgi:hypothetical protein
VRNKLTGEKYIIIAPLYSQKCTTHNRILRKPNCRSDGKNCSFYFIGIYTVQTNRIECVNYRYPVIHKNYELSTMNCRESMLEEITDE